jgi:hypothetical protein
MRHFWEKVVGPILEEWRRRFRQIITTLEYLGFPPREELIGFALVRCMRALAHLAAVDPHGHHPVEATSAFVEGAHLVFNLQ